LYALGDALGGLYYLAAGERRNVARQNIALAFGRRFTPAQRDALARQSCRHVLKTMLEFLRLPELSPEALAARVPLTGAEHLRESLARGRGVILLTPHLGNWEYMAARVAVAGFPLTVVGRDAANPVVAQLLRNPLENLPLHSTLHRRATPFSRSHLSYN
jgi:KDO2-lipid IV(A) lauroyltransferase